MTSRGKLTGYLQVAQVMSGALLRNLLRGLFKLLVAGVLAPGALGIVRSVYALFRLVASLADLGIDYATVTFVSAAIGRGNDDEKRQILRTTLGLKLLVAVTVFLVGNLVAPWVAATILGDPALTIWVRVVFFAVGGQLLWKYLSSLFSAEQQFGRVAAFVTTMPVVMFVSALILIPLGRFNLTSVMLIYLLSPLVTVLVWLPVLDPSLLRPPARIGGLLRKIVRFSRWVYLSNLASANRNHINPLLLKNPGLSGSVSAGEVSAGLYGFGADLAGEITVLSQSLLTVLLPKASAKPNAVELRRFVRRSYLHLAWLIVPLVLLVFAARPFLLLLGQLRPSFLDYLPAVPIFAILYIGGLFSLATIPMQTAIYAMGRPQLETGVELAGAVVLVVGSLVLIPTKGAEGAATMVLIQRALTFFALGWLGMRALVTHSPEPTS